MWHTTYNAAEKRKGIAGGKEQEMKADKECLECCRKKVEGLLDQYRASESIRTAVLSGTEKILAQGEEQSAPVLMAEVFSCVEKYLAVTDAYETPKRKYNQILIEQEQKLKEEIMEAEDPFLAGLQCAVTGNYIDFGAMSDVNEEKLYELLLARPDIRLDQEEVETLRTEIEKAGKLVYITDNAGEIVLDKVFIELLQRWYPDLEIRVIVRGVPVLNDATYMDAEVVGLTKIAQVLPNGTDVPGTPLDEISQEALKEVKEADLCIAKGQGNFETLRGCGLNIYYLFLCKCSLFVKKFNVQRFSPVLSNEKRIVQYV